MKISDIVLDGIGFDPIRKNKLPLFDLKNPSTFTEGHRVDISRVYVGDNDIHHSIFELKNWYITKFSETAIIISDTPTLNASADTIVITPQDLLSPDYHTKFYDYDYADYDDNVLMSEKSENYSNFPFSIIRPDQIYVFSNDVMINCEYVIDLVFDNGEKLRIIAQVMDKTIDRMECHGLILANRITDSDTFYSDRITFNLGSSKRIAFISIKRDDLSDPDYPCITDITMYKIKEYCLQVRFDSEFDSDLMDACFLDKED